MTDHPIPIEFVLDILGAMGKLDLSKFKKLTDKHAINPNLAYQFLSQHKVVLYNDFMDTTNTPAPRVGTAEMAAFIQAFEEGMDLPEGSLKVTPANGKSMVFTLCVNGAEVSYIYTPSKSQNLHELHQSLVFLCMDMVEKPAAMGQ